MSRQGTPKGGLALLAQRAIGGATLSLVAYTNAQDSLGPDSVVGNLVQPAQTNGYGPITLDGTWSYTDGVATYTHSAGGTNDGIGNPCWYPSGAWSAPVTGVAVLSGGVLQHFYDLRDPVTGQATSFIAAAGRKLAVEISDLVSP